jgi:molybdopterin converting factor small subunit
MKVRLKLFATFRRYLPPGTQGSARDMEVPEKESLVILVNGRDAGPDRVLQEGDVVAVFPTLAGG